MINTLRITSIIAAILAGIFFVFPVVFGVRSDESLDKFLKSPGLVEKFNSAAGNKARQGESRVSPLVQQAETFALYLNPPKPQIAEKTTEQKTPTTQEMPVTPKFTVLGTCFHKERPEMSLALIDEPGKGLHWVRQSSKVGHLLIEEVKDGLVVVKGSKGTFERPVEQKPTTSLPTNRPTGTTPVSAGPRVQNRTRPSSPPLGRVPSGVSRTRSVPPSQPQRSAEETAKLEELVSKLKNLQRSSTSDKTSSGPSQAEKAAMVEKLISNFKSSRISDAEAKKLDTLGKNLKDIREDPNRSGPSKTDKVETVPPKPGGSAEK
jgi:hypothetical protein